MLTFSYKNDVFHFSSYHGIKTFFDPENVTDLYKNEEVISV